MMRQSRPYLLLALIGLVLFSGPEAQAASKAPEVGTQGQSVAAKVQAMVALHARLSASPRAADQHSVLLTADEAAILTNPAVDSTGRFRVGIHRAVGRRVSSKGADLIVRIQGAPAIRLELTQVKGTVAVFNDAGEAHEYTKDGFTHTFSGDEVRVRGSAHITGAGAVNLASNLCGFNASCTQNAECSSIPLEIDAVRNAYASILFMSRGSYYVCSGGLIADSDSSTEIPYFLTANHCVGRDREASTVETRFQYILSSCEPGKDCNLYTSDWGDTVGSTIKATDSSGDFTLLELSLDGSSGSVLPSGSVFLGWSSDPVAYSNGVELYRISHPGGAPQAYSEHIVDTSATTCQSLDRGDYIYSRDDFGATEGGSSGSPVMNAQAQVVGQLYGACGYNVNDQCDAVSNATVDGAFAYYYPKVQPFLGDGSAECSQAVDCDDGDACTTDTCVGGTCSNTPVSCDDSDACTTDKCDGGICSNTPVSCDDGNACTTDSCDPVTGCSNTEIICNDDNLCTADSCNPTDGLCLSDPILPCCGNGSCEDGEDQCSCPVDCGYPPSTETDCSDGIDNNCDGLVDCADSDCLGDSNCSTTCSDWTDKETCNLDPNCVWSNRNKVCEDSTPPPPPSGDCSKITDRKVCLADGCSWEPSTKKCF